MEWVEEELKAMEAGSRNKSDGIFSVDLNCTQVDKSAKKNNFTSFKFQEHPKMETMNVEH